MSKYLVSTVETYRVDTEEEATAIIAEAKQALTPYTLGKYTSEHKERRSKGEVIDEYYKVTFTKMFNDIKEPETVVDIAYEVK